MNTNNVANEDCPYTTELNASDTMTTNQVHSNLDKAAIVTEDSYTEDKNINHEVAPSIGESQTGTVKMIEDDLAKNDLSQNKFALVDIDEMLNSVSSLNYIEAARIKQKVLKEYENFKMAKNLLDAINGMDKIDPLNKKIASENVLESTEYKEDAQKFLAEYENNIKRFDSIISALDSRMKTFDLIPKTSKFLDDQMIDSLNKRIKEFTDKGVIPNSAIMLNLQIIKHIYEHRDDLSFIQGKSNIEYMITKYRKLLKNHYDDEMKKVKNEFLRIFNAKQMDTFEKKILELANNQENTANLFMLHLYKIIIAEKADGKYNWVKVLIMNVIDIEAGIYDLDTPKEEYYSKLSDILFKYQSHQVYNK